MNCNFNGKYNYIDYGTYIYFLDEGYVTEKSKTRLFAVHGRDSHVLLGYIKWYAPWHKYVFFTENIILEEVCMTEIAEFIKLRTKEYRSTQKKKPFKHSDEYNSKKGILQNKS